MRVHVAVAIALFASALLACGALLGLPDQTNADPNFGVTEGGGPDLSPLPDGFVPDGGMGKDTSLVSDSSNGCNCFGGTCNGDVCQPVALTSAKIDPNLLDVDMKNNVYFASGVHDIFALDANNLGAGLRAITNKQEPTINDLHVANNYVYFTNYTGVSNNNSVSRCAAGLGCASARDEYSSSPTKRTFGLALDNTDIFFTIADSSANGGGLWRCTQSGCSGAKSVLPRNLPGRIVTNGFNLGWLETNQNNGVEECDYVGANFYSSNQVGIVDLTWDKADLYFVTGSAMYYQAGPVPMQYGVANNGVAIRADASYVYWLNGGSNGSLIRCPLQTDCLNAPKKAVTLASNLNNPFGLALSNDSIYFTTRNDQTVWRLAK